MTKFAIGIPTINRADLLMPSLEKYQNDFPNTDIHVIDNGNQTFESYQNTNISIWKQQQNLGVAASWNKLCEIIFRTHDWALLVNDDVYLGYDTETVNSAINTCEVGIMQSYYNWSVLLISKELFEKVGKFDANFFPAYYEDSDYMYRLRLLGLQHEVNHILDPIDFKQSQTYEKDPDLVNMAMKENSYRYQRKWGGVPLLEQFTIPYNNDRTAILEGMGLIMSQMTRFFFYQGFSIISLPELSMMDETEWGFRLIDIENRIVKINKISDENKFNLYIENLKAVKIPKFRNKKYEELCKKMLMVTQPT
jgi:glycosyltransferase involved in cell wall biosynthesis